MNKGFQTLLGLLVLGIIAYFLYPVLIPRPAEQVTFTLETYQSWVQTPGQGYFLGRFKFTNNTDQPVYIVYNCTAINKNGTKHFTTDYTSYPLGIGNGYYEDESLFHFNPMGPIRVPDDIQSITLDGFSYSFTKPIDR